MDDRLLKNRERIDEINNALISLLDERFNISFEIGKIKREIGMEVFDAKREEIIIENIKQKLVNSKYIDEILNVFLTVLEESKKIQK